MSDQSIKLTYAIDTATMANAMKFAGARLQKSASPRTKTRNYLSLALAFGVLIFGPMVLNAFFQIDVLNAGFLFGLVWATGAFFIMQRVAIKGLAESVTETAMKRGSIKLTIGPGGLSEQSGIGRMDIVWDVVNDIEGIAGSTVIRFGGMCFAIPDTALPDDLSPDQFREKLISWRDAEDVFG